MQEANAMLDAAKAQHAPTPATAPSESSTSVTTATVTMNGANVGYLLPAAEPAPVPLPADLPQEVDSLVQTVLTGGLPALRSPRAIAAALALAGTIATNVGASLNAGALPGDILKLFIAFAATEATVEITRILGVSFGQPLATGARRKDQ